MSERLAPWRAKPSQAVVDQLQALQTTVLYLVHRTGPTSFLVREDGQEVKRKVMIGARPHCSCNPLVWQLSLNDRELDEALCCATVPSRPASTVDPAADKKKVAGSDEGEGYVTRKALDEEDPCPICYEDMCGRDPAHLVWCRRGCGSNVHGKCLSVWAEHQTKTLDKPLTCPLCRTDWGDFTWRPPPPQRKRLAKTHEVLSSTVHLGTCCFACKKAPITGALYRCLVCAKCDLCDTCFQGGHHSQHPFACKPTPNSFPEPAQRAELMPTAAGIAASHNEDTEQVVGTDRQEQPAALATAHTRRAAHVGATADSHKPPLGTGARPGKTGLLPIITRQQHSLGQGLVLEGQCIQTPTTCYGQQEHSTRSTLSRDSSHSAPAAGKAGRPGRRQPHVMSPSEAAAAAALARLAAADSDGAQDMGFQGLQGIELAALEQEMAAAGQAACRLLQPGRRHRGSTLRVGDAAGVLTGHGALAGMQLQGMSVGAACSDGHVTARSGAVLSSRPLSGQHRHDDISSAVGLGGSSRMWGVRAPGKLELQVALQRHGRFIKAMSLARPHQDATSTKQHETLGMEALQGRSLRPREWPTTAGWVGNELVSTGRPLSRQDSIALGMAGADAGIHTP